MCYDCLSSFSEQLRRDAIYSLSLCSVYIFGTTICLQNNSFIRGWFLQLYMVLWRCGHAPRAVISHKVNLLIHTLSKLARLYRVICLWWSCICIFPIVHFQVICSSLLRGLPCDHSVASFPFGTLLTYTSCMFDSDRVNFQFWISKLPALHAFAFSFTHMYCNTHVHECAGVVWCVSGETEMQHGSIFFLIFSRSATQVQKEYLSYADLLTRCHLDHISWGIWKFLMKLSEYSRFIFFLFKHMILPESWNLRTTHSQDCQIDIPDRWFASWLGIDFFWCFFPPSPIHAYAVWFFHRSPPMLSSGTSSQVHKISQCLFSYRCTESHYSSSISQRRIFADADIWTLSVTSSVAACARIQSCDESILFQGLFSGIYLQHPTRLFKHSPSGPHSFLGWLISRLIIRFSWLLTSSPIVMTSTSRLCASSLINCEGCSHLLS